MYNNELRIGETVNTTEVVVGFEPTKIIVEE